MSFGSPVVFTSRPVAFRHLLTKVLALSGISNAYKMYTSTQDQFPLEFEDINCGILYSSAYAMNVQAASRSLRGGLLLLVRVFYDFFIFVDIASSDHDLKIIQDLPFRNSFSP
jgi:hypothetical protein